MLGSWICSKELAEVCCTSCDPTGSVILVIMMWLHAGETTLSCLQVSWCTVRELSAGKNQSLKIIIELLRKTRAEILLGSSMAWSQQGSLVRMGVMLVTGMSSPPFKRKIKSPFRTNVILGLYLYLGSLHDFAPCCGFTCLFCWVFQVKVQPPAWGGSEEWRGCSGTREDTAL